MTVSELIAELSKLNQGAVVHLPVGRAYDAVKPAAFISFTDGSHEQSVVYLTSASQLPAEDPPIDRALEAMQMNERVEAMYGIDRKELIREMGRDAKAYLAESRAKNRAMGIEDNRTWPGDDEYKG